IVIADSVIHYRWNEPWFSLLWTRVGLGFTAFFGLFYVGLYATLIYSYLTVARRLTNAGPPGDDDRRDSEDRPRRGNDGQRGRGAHAPRRWDSPLDPLGLALRLATAGIAAEMGRSHARRRNAAPRGDRVHRLWQAPPHAGRR